MAAPLVAALSGARGPFAVTLNLAPGDGPYWTGFTSPSKPYEPYEIVDRVSTLWTTRDARVSLPLVVEGAPVTLSYRFARPLPQPAVVEVATNGRTVDRFTPAKAFAERSAVSVPPGALPLDLTLHVAALDDRSLGVRLDWVRWEAGAGGRLRLRGAARFRAALGIGVLLGLLLALGWGPPAAALLVAPASVGATIGLLRDPWLTHRLLTGVPEALLAFGLVGVAVGRRLLSRGRTEVRDVRRAAALAIATFLLRALAVNHPDYYYPDLLLHVRLVKVVHDAGLDFLRAPSTYIWKPQASRAEGAPREVRATSGLWFKQTGGRFYGMPYSLAFHAPFALLPLTFDRALIALKLAGALVSTLPILLVFALARRLGASPLAALLMAFAPIYAQRLAVAALPALFGHAVDLAFLLWLAARVGEIDRPRVLLAGAALVAACQLAYVSGVVNTALLVGLAALALLAERRVGGLRLAAALVLAGVLGSALALLAYYRDFLGTIVALVGGASAPEASGHESVGGLALPVSRFYTFYGWAYPLLAGPGFLLLLRRGKARAVLVAWGLAFVFLQVLRGIAPDVFRWVHDLLLVAPLVCLGAGDALAALDSQGRLGRVVAAGLVTLLAVQGLAQQWRALAEQLGNAR